ncbi:MAG: hypothetical protein GIKADHBN_03001 [Phycisphaerales bacterium]|nr:hypothetical protein [Phycisphaerales bacterium]
MTRRAFNPVATILGDAACAGGPWALLGLVPGPVTDQQVVEALERRLQQIERHPLGGVPEADDVRLALHAAAAQILNPQVRASLLSGGGVPEPIRPDRTADAAAMEVAPFLHIIARHGGVNDRSLRQMLVVAAASGRSPAALISQIRDMLVTWSHGRRVRPALRTGRPHAEKPAAPATTAASPAADEPTFGDVDPGVRALKMIVVTAFAIIAAASVVTIGVLMLLNTPQATDKWIPDPPPVADTSRPGELFPSANEPPPAPPPSPASDEPPAEAQADDPIKMVRAIAHAASNVATAPESSLEEFGAAARGLTTRWDRLAPDQLGLAQDSIVEFLYRSPTPEIGESALDSVTAIPSPQEWTPERVLAEVWRAGILSRLGRERDLSSGLRAKIDERYPAGSVAVTTDAGTFVRGGLARLASMPAEMVATPPGVVAAPPSPALAKVRTAAWAAWKRAASRLSGSDEAGYDRMVVQALETVLTDGPEPAVDHGLGEVIRELVLSASWRKDSLARRWLIASFSSPDLSAADLDAVTRTLVQKSGSEGVKSDMVLGASSDEKTRLELREKYAGAWGLSDPARRDELVAAWREQADLASQPLQIDPSQDPHHAGALAAALTKARLSHAAAMMWAGLINEPAALIKDPGEVSNRLMAQAAASTPPRRIDEGGTDGAWAVQYLAAEHRVPERLKLLTELTRSNRPLGQVDAEIIVAEAVRGSPEVVRNAARDAVDLWSSSPAVLYAMLEESYRMPKTRTNAETITLLTMARLPTLKDPGWYAGVRRALVERLLHVLTTAGPQRTIDFLADELGATCAGRARPADAAADPIDQSASVASRRSVEREYPAVAIEDLLVHWRKTAEPLLPTGREPLTTEAIERRLNSRLALATGPIQHFAARHLAVAELMAYVVAIEQPGRATEVAIILDKLAGDRRTAGHILDQINAAELAMLRLWQIRLEGGLS